MRRLVLAALLASPLAFANDAHAIEKQHHIGVAPMFAMLQIDDKSTVSTGAGLALHYTYGITDQLDFMAEVGGAVVAANQKQDLPSSPHTRPAEIDHALGGVGYVIDILQWVPYVGVLAGGYRFSGGTIDGSLFLPGAAVTIGIDYQITRNWAVGIAGHEHFLLTKMSTYPTYTTALLRFEYSWGF